MCWGVGEVRGSVGKCWESCKEVHWGEWERCAGGRGVV